MAVAIGDGRHYVVSKIVPRHFLETADLTGLPKAVVVDAFKEFYEAADAAIDQARNSLPKKFPTALATSIVDGLRNRFGDVKIFLDDLPAV